MMCSVPPTRYPRSRDRLNVSGTTPSPGNAASPWMQIGSTSRSSRPPSASGTRWYARAIPDITGFTTSRWLGFGASSSRTVTSPTFRSPS